MANIIVSDLKRMFLKFYRCPKSFDFAQGVRFMEYMETQQKPDYKPLAITFLSAAVFTVYMGQEKTMEWTQETAASIHSEAIADGEKRSRIFNAAIPLGDTERRFTLLSFSLRSVRKEAQAQDNAAPIICVTETGGWRLPFTTTAYAASSSACAIGYNMNNPFFSTNLPEYALRYR
jgi:hypothetical protein